MSEQTAETLELDALKETATELGISFHPNISLEKLKIRVADAMVNPTPEPVAEGPTEKTPEEVKAAALKLVRVQVTCMDPSKREYEGTILQTGNKLIGTVKKYVHFNEPWHVPHCIYDMLKNAKYQTFVTKQVMTSAGIPQEIKEGKLVPTYAVSVLPDLTEAELKDLAQRQAMANGTAAAA